MRCKIFYFRHYENKRRAATFLKEVKGVPMFETNLGIVLGGAIRGKILKVCLSRCKNTPSKFAEWKLEIIGILLNDRFFTLFR